MATKRELCEADDAGWDQFLELVGSLLPEQLEEPGYTVEGWSVKDLMAHIGNWQAEACCALEQIRCGTYQPGEVDVDGLNARFHEVNRDLPLSVVRAECWSAHTRMLTEWNALTEPIPEAEEWFYESGPNHYQEHLPRLREWVEELRSR
jgi:hypothetical protein